MNSCGIIESVSKVMKLAQDVRINEEAVYNFANQCVRLKEAVNVNLLQHDYDELTTCAFIIVFNAINFTYWVFPYDEKWHIIEEEEKLDGAVGLCRALERAYRQGVPIFETKFLHNLSYERFKNIIDGKGKLYLLKERVNCLNEIGKVLKNRFKYVGDILECFKNDVIKIVEYLITNFKSFDDRAYYKNINVIFHKRAQLAAKMLNDALAKQNISFCNVDALTAFADYKLPQILHSAGCLEYSEKLRKKIDNFEELQANSSLECEIRAATILAVKKISDWTLKYGRFINQATIDGIIWLMGQKQNKNLKPYHRTLTIYY